MHQRCIRKLKKIISSNFLKIVLFYKFLWPRIHTLENSCCTERERQKERGKKEKYLLFLLDSRGLSASILFEHRVGKMRHFLDSQGSMQSPR